MAQKLNVEKFEERMLKIYNFWNEERNELLSKVDAVAILLGADNDVTYSKSLAMHTWLFGYEIPDTLLILCKKEIYFLASKKKLDFLSGVKNRNNELPTLHLLEREKADKDKANFEKITSAIKASGNGSVLGEFSKEKASGEFVKSWKAARNELDGGDFESQDISVPLGLIMAAKDESEIALIKSACDATSTLFTKYLKDQLVGIVDADKKIKHSKISKGVEEALEKKKFINVDDPSHIDVCYPPIIQSGKNANLKFSVLSDDNNVHFGAIICSLGLRYKQYCSNVVRTLLVDPSQNLQDTYSLLVDVETKVLESMKPGVKLSDVYEAAVDVLRDAKRTDLLDKMTKSVGFGMGIEFRESALLINAKNAVSIEQGMTFNINLGFAQIPNDSGKDSEGKQVSMFVGDTVVVNENGAVSLTEAAKKKVKNICMFFRNEEENEKEAEDDDKENIDEVFGRGKRSVVLQEQLRKKQTGEDRRKRHQKELAEQLNKIARERLAQAMNKVDEQKTIKSNVSYKNVSMLPSESEVGGLQIYVDRKHEAVIVPIFGVPVPYHISMIKNISQSIEGDFTYLRLNFFHPGATIGKENIMFPKPDAHFVKEITFRSTNKKEPGEISAPSSNLNTAFRLIKEVQKRFKTREAEEREKEGVVKQDKLVLSQGKQNPRLKDLYIRPNIVSKRLSGTLEAHTNGFRYTSIRGDKVDILYNNIKHALFQPCDHEMIILLHFHLKHAILFGKRKHVDIQFFTEVGEITTDLGKHTHMNDRDDMYAEQKEQELRDKLNRAFKGFCEKVAKVTNDEFEFDTPFRDLGFFGVPHRSSVLLQPTSSCLVNLTDWPTFMVTLEEVELVHFERVQFHLKNFDMVFIFKDYSKKLSMVTAIPMNMLDHVKEWLDSCDIRYTEGIQSLNWPKIMKTIVEDPEGFFENGGWNFLNAESDEEGDDDDLEDGDDVYAPSDEEGSDDEEESDEDSDDEYESEATSDSESEASVASDESSGKDWSDLEEEAIRADKERTVDDDDDRHHGRSGDTKRKAGPPTKKAPPPKKRR